MKKTNKPLSITQRTVLRMWVRKEVKLGASREEIETLIYEKEKKQERLGRKNSNNAYDRNWIREFLDVQFNK